MKVAVIGAGPAGLAFTDKLLELRKDISIDIYYTLSTPFSILMQFLLQLIRKIIFVKVKIH